MTCIQFLATCEGQHLPAATLQPFPSPALSVPSVPREPALCTLAPEGGFHLVAMGQEPMSGLKPLLDSTRVLVQALFLLLTF